MIPLFTWLVMHTTHAACPDLQEGPFIPGSGTYDLVVNGDFEDGAGDAADHWAEWGANQDAMGRISDTHLVYDGSHAMGRTNPAWAGGPSFHHQSVTLQGGEWYTASAMLYYDATAGRMYIDLWDQAVEHLDGTYGDIEFPVDTNLTAAPQWRLYECTFRVPGTGPQTLSLRTVFDFGWGPGDAAFDDVAITPADVYEPPELEPEEPPYVDDDLDGYSVEDGDCDDTDASRSPDAVEQCNGIDDDCDGVVDDGVPVSSWYTDADGDGFGDAHSVVDACAQPADGVKDAADCDDSDASVHPDATEVFDDGIDNDCDGELASTIVTGPDVGRCGCAAQAHGRGPVLPALWAFVLLARRRQRLS